jgi:hypothetical protein
MQVSILSARCHHQGREPLNSPWTQHSRSTWATAAVGARAGLGQNHRAGDHRIRVLILS